MGTDPARRLALAVVVLGLAVGFANCRRQQAPPAQRLVDVYTADAVSNRLPSGPPPPRTEWLFAGDSREDRIPPELAATRGWQAFHDVADLAIGAGRLRGRARGDLPIVHFERTAGLDDSDVVHHIEVRLRASAGGNLKVSLSAAERLDKDSVLDYARNFPADFTTPLVAGDELRTYTLTSPLSIQASRARHIFIQPTDKQGATFEIESLRLVFRREHLASVPSGVGFQGLAEIYRETVVARAPETVRWRVTLPARPWLDLAVGTLGGRAGHVLAVGVARGRRRRPGAAPCAHADAAVPLGGHLAGPRGLRRPRGGAVSCPRCRETGNDRVLGLSRCALAERGGAAEQPQGVILIWADTLRRDHLGVYGYQRATSPNIDRLAAEGTLFRDCIGQASWTKVATPSLMTSLYPASHGVFDFADRLPASAQTLAESYRAAGYATLAFSSILFTGKFTNLHQGFEEVHESGSLPNPDSSKTSREYVDRVLPWLGAHRDVPFFVFLHVADPHDPYRPEAPYDTVWADAARAPQHAQEGVRVKRFIADPLLRNLGAMMPTREELLRAGIEPNAYVGYDRDLYDGSIRGLDAEIGRLVERLRTLGLDRKVLLVFTGDHGEEFLDHGRMFHGQSVYGELDNVPLILWGAGVRPRVVEETVETIDIMPTLLAASRLAAPAGLQGRSLGALLAAPGAANASTGRWLPRPAISEKNATTMLAGAPPPRDTESFAIVADGWKLIHNTKRANGAPEFELYDHHADPRDAHPLTAQHPEIVARLAAELRAWRKMANAARLKPDASAGAVSSEDLERLRALGYIQ